jgi:hypothetical protein
VANHQSGRLCREFCERRCSFRGVGHFALIECQRVEQKQDAPSSILV